MLAQYGLNKLQKNIVEYWEIRLVNIFEESILIYTNYVGDFSKFSDTIYTYTHTYTHIFTYIYTILNSN